ncbi:MAG: hypothetical protein ACU0CQ_10300 [Sulfitobacter sp.]|jgi:hypothetical protein|uniref:hypothetical protein n=1 Tax=Sulfitobacter sp. TaxID=1903071 RepID=UPI000C39673B|nr:hypothetical protein [Roseobacter sp.]MBV50761.1 hypothetical protein [Roseobacter sp.]|tara:strand:+ start:325 stop:675 length:351 start_codon:yes stop_codon:yes gene_type:complete
MTTTLALLIMVLVVWMIAAGWCGFAKRFFGFVLVLAIGLALNWGWMVWGLDAKPFEHPVLVAQGAAIGYALCAFAIGWMAGRITREFQATRIERNTGQQVSLGLTQCEKDATPRYD